MKQKLYSLEHVITSVNNIDGTRKNLSINEFIVIPTNYKYNDISEVECARIDMSRNAENGYYRIVKL